MSCGIYCIKNKINGRCYIGSSADIERRFDEHKYGLLTGNHPNGKLQIDWDKYIETDFGFSILEECEKDMLVYKEQYYIDKLRSDVRLYNLTNSKIIMYREDKSKAVKRVTYYLRGDTIGRIKALARASEMGISEVLQEILDKVLDNVDIK